MRRYAKFQVFGSTAFELLRMFGRVRFPAVNGGLTETWILNVIYNEYKNIRYQIVYSQ